MYASEVWVVDRIIMNSLPRFWKFEVKKKLKKTLEKSVYSCAKVT